MNTLSEQLLQRVKTVLLGAGTAAGANVYRDRADAIPAEDECPCIRVLRGEVPSESFGAGVDKATVHFKLELAVAGVDREQALDALHLEAHLAIFADSTLQKLPGLRCIGTDEPEHLSADPSVATMTATYRGYLLSHTGDLASAP